MRSSEVLERNIENQKTLEQEDDIQTQVLTLISPMTMMNSNYAVYTDPSQLIRDFKSCNCKIICFVTKSNRLHYCFNVVFPFHGFLVITVECTVVGDNINIMKTTFELNFDSYQAFKQHGYTKIWKQREAVNLKSFTLNTCKRVIRKKLVNN